MVFHPYIVCRLGYRRLKKCKFDTETYTWKIGRVATFLERQLWFGGGSSDNRHLFVTRGFGKFVEHDNIQRHPHIVVVRSGENHHYGRKKNQNRRYGTVETNQQNRLILSFQNIQMPAEMSAFAFIYSDVLNNTQIL